MYVGAPLPTGACRSYWALRRLLLIPHVQSNNLTRKQKAGGMGMGGMGMGMGGMMQAGGSFAGQGGYGQPAGMGMVRVRAPACPASVLFSHQPPS